MLWPAGARGSTSELVVDELEDDHGSDAEDDDEAKEDGNTPPAEGEAVVKEDAQPLLHGGAAGGVRVRARRKLCMLIRTVTSSVMHTHPGSVFAATHTSWQNAAASGRYKRKQGMGAHERRARR